MTRRNLSPSQAEFLSYLRGIIMSGKPYTSKEAGEATSRTAAAAGRLLMDLRHKGHIKTETKQFSGFWCVRVTIDGLGTTPWPPLPTRRAEPCVLIRKAQDEGERIVKERQRIEDERMQRRQEWLSKEYRGRGRHPMARRKFDGAEAAIARAYAQSQVSQEGGVSA